ncbi:MAG: hypothetical protein ABH823_00830 [bacterium]
MTILSPIMSFIVDRQVGFPIPSEKEKINKVLKRYRYILGENSKRADAPEIMFGIADLLVGRNNPGDYSEAGKLYDHILLRHIPDSLRGRALIGKAELMIGRPEEFDNAISFCDKAKKLLGSDMTDFFAAKTHIVEAELLLARNHGSDWAKALKLIDRVIKSRDAHWYFQGRALLTKGEITLYRKPKDLRTPLKLVDKALVSLKSREDDYFTNKGKVLKAEILIRRAKGGDFPRAEKLLLEVVKMSLEYAELIARAKIDLADIVNNPKAKKYLQEVNEMEGLDPYLIEKAQLIEQAITERKKQDKKKKKK